MMTNRQIVKSNLSSPDFQAQIIQSKTVVGVTDIKMFLVNIQYTLTFAQTMMWFLMRGFDIIKCWHVLYYSIFFMIVSRRHEGKIHKSVSTTVTLPKKQTTTYHKLSICSSHGVIWQKSLKN